ncbi:hypothetical protein LTR93_011847 [Exophiala xenobiotica]|nr:hypothetical protein LTR93_011847 [Exophiala xenobiotica]
MVDGKSIPAGTHIGISPLKQNRDMDVFGSDPDTYRPEKRLEDPEKANYMDTMNMTFGGTGSRMCIGRSLALVEVHKFMALMLHNFDIGFPEPNKAWHITSYWFAYQHDREMWIRAKPGRMLRNPERS